MGDKKVVALYIRVSSREQRLEGLSLSGQENRLVKYCQDKGYTIYKLYNEGRSAKSIKGRKKFRELIEDAKNKNFSTVLVTKYDRAFRNLLEALSTQEELEKIGIDIISLNENIDIKTPIGRAMFTMINLFAQLEGELTSSRNKDIREDKFENGIVTTKIPFGYRATYSNKREKKGIVSIEVDEVKSKIVQEIFLMASNGISYREICNKYKIKPQIYYNILRNRFYLGYIKFDDKEKIGSHKPIISQEIFDKANKNIKPIVIIK